MTGNRRNPKNRTRETRSPFGKMLHEKFLDNDNILQTQLAKEIAEITRDARLVQGSKKVDESLISKMVQGTYFEQGEELVKQLYIIFYTLKKRYIQLPSDEVRELLQLIPKGNLTDGEREALIARLINEEIVTPVYYFSEQGKNNHRLIGRHKDIQIILQQLTDKRTQLVNMIGLPGVGKTRLAEQIQEQARRLEYFAIIHKLISFNEQIDSEEVIRRIRDQRHGADPHKQALVILDNCEQIADINKARGEIAHLLQENPKLSILAISTIAFVDKPYRVEPLKVPEHQHEPRKKLRTYTAIEYFLNRAGIDHQPYELTDGNAEKIAALCIALDGLPLALKIIASWVNQIGIDELYNSLFDKTVYMLQYAFNDIDRHNSLNVAMALSYSKLQPDEQKLFRRLAIFASSCSLEALSVVCNIDNDLPIDLPAHKATLLTMLKTLENHSFITFPKEGRVSISHHTLSQFAKQELDQDEKADEVKAQFAFYYSEQVEKYMAARYKIGQLGVEIDIDEYIASENYRKFKTPFDDMEFDDPAHYDRDRHMQARREKEAEYWSTRPFLVDEFDNLLAAYDMLGELRRGTIEYLVWEIMGEEAYREVIRLIEDLEKREASDDGSIGNSGKKTKFVPSVTQQRMDFIMERLTGADYHSDYDIGHVIADLYKCGYGEQSEEIKRCLKYYVTRRQEANHHDLVIGIDPTMLYLWDDLFLFELAGDISPSILRRRKLRTKRYNSYPRLEQEGEEGIYIILTSPHDLW